MRLPSVEIRKYWSGSTRLLYNLLKRVTQMVHIFLFLSLPNKYLGQTENVLCRPVFCLIRPVSINFFLLWIYFRFRGCGYPTGELWLLADTFITRTSDSESCTQKARPNGRCRSNTLHWSTKASTNARYIDFHIYNTHRTDALHNISLIWSDGTRK